MKTLGVITIIWLSLFALALLILHIKSKRMIKSIFSNAIYGLLAIVLINLTQKFTGVFVPLNWYTVGGSSAFGIPYVCGIILLQALI